MHEGEGLVFAGKIPEHSRRVVLGRRHPNGLARQPGELVAGASYPEGNSSEGARGEKGLSLPPAWLQPRPRQIDVKGVRCKFNS